MTGGLLDSASLFAWFGHCVIAASWAIQRRGSTNLVLVAIQGRSQGWAMVDRAPRKVRVPTHRLWHCIEYCGNITHSDPVAVFVNTLLVKCVSKKQSVQCRPRNRILLVLNKKLSYCRDSSSWRSLCRSSSFTVTDFSTS